MAALLRAHRERQAASRPRAGWRKNDLVFPSATGTHLDASHMRTRFNRLLRKAGLPHIRFHDLRHTSASLLLAADVHPKIVQERLGHADPRLTLALYSHLLPGLEEGAADRMEWAVGMGPDAGD